MKYEREGLFIGLISFPFFVDGENLFRKVFESFFLNHRGHLQKICLDLPDIYYKPAAYRLLGSYGLAVFSLIDDYSFSSRVFNQSHIDEANEYFQDVSKCKATVLTGSSETLDDDKPYLIPRSEDTFLAARKRYPFVGIIRIKVKCARLEGKGSVLTRQIKTKIEQMAATLNGDGDRVRIIIIDSYDNNELVVSSFSTSLNTICDLVERIKDIKENDSHIIEACHTSFGAHVDFKMSGGSQNFREWEETVDKERFKVNMLVETKPGHQDTFRKRIKDEYRKYVNRGLDPRETQMLEPRVTVTGGGVLFYELTYEILPWIYKNASEKCGDRWMYLNSSRVKLTLACTVNDRADHAEDHCAGQFDRAFIQKEDIDTVKHSLAKLGVSKTVRESVLSLFAFYNYCVNNKLQCYYIKTLKQSVLNLGRIPDMFFEPKDPTPLLEIERYLSDEVKCLEMAICDRMNNNMEPNVVLEYVCGIHQILYGFGTTYHTVSNILEPKKTDPYSFIVAKSKECSTKTHVELNINHLIYPELFVTTAWKEASNFSFDNLKDLQPELEDRERYDNIQKYLSNLRNQRYQDELASNVYAELLDASDNQVCQHIMNILHEDKLFLIKYVLSDVMVYHFAYQSDFQLMWDAYFNVFLQMSSNYSRPGKVLMKPFILLLLRLHLVAFSDIDNKDKNLDMVQDRVSKPFDPVLSGLWYLCYTKVMRASLCIYDIWNPDEGKTQFCDVIHDLQCYFERKINPSLVTDIESIHSEKERRSERVAFLNGQLKNREVINFDGQYTDEENVICVLNAFYMAVHELSEIRCKTIHCLLRNPDDGTIWFEKYKENTIRKSSSRILADPDGGFVIPDHEVRKDYFAYRTWLYRTLWDISYRKYSSST